MISTQGRFPAALRKRNLQQMPVSCLSFLSADFDQQLQPGKVKQKQHLPAIHGLFTAVNH